MRPNTVRRTLWLGLGVVAVAAVAAASASGGSDRALVSSTLKPFTSLTLSGSKGSIRAVVYDGNEARSASTAMTGFTVPAAPFTAKTTFVIADGQCSSASPNGCRGVHSLPGALGDTLSFVGGAGAATVGPDALKGSDGCMWGQDTCLWDTLSFDVSHYVASGDTTESVTLTAENNSPADCFNHEAQVFAVGPSSAWTDAGYVAAGVGLRNQGSGRIALSGIPAGAVVQKAFLYWNVLNELDPLGAIAVNQRRFGGTMIGRDEDTAGRGRRGAGPIEPTSPRP